MLAIFFGTAAAVPPTKAARFLQIAMRNINSVIALN
jgi:hypothetical protein